MTQVSRCPWCGTDPLYVQYHDEEWGVSVYDDRVLFEFLILEGAQAGLSWITVLKRRNEYRKAFANFDSARVAQFTEAQIVRILANSGVIRNKLKVRGAVQNAKVFLAIQAEFGSFADYLWAWTAGEVIKNTPVSLKDVPAQTPLSVALSQDLSARGMTFVGPTIMCAYLQAVGMVNDHLSSCFVTTSKKSKK